MRVSLIQKQYSGRVVRRPRNMSDFEWDCLIAHAQGKSLDEVASLFGKQQRKPIIAALGRAIRKMKAAEVRKGEFVASSDFYIRPSDDLRERLKLLNHES